MVSAVVSAIEVDEVVAEAVVEPQEEEQEVVEVVEEEASLVSKGVLKSLLYVWSAFLDHTIEPFLGLQD